MPPRTSSHALIAAVVDEGSWVSWDEPPTVAAQLTSSYAAELAAAADKAGTDEALITGTGSIGGHRVAVIVSEFDFLAGSIGVAAARRAVAAIERATREQLPLFASPASGGTRMQEGTPAFVTMISITAAINAFKRERLPYITYLRHPTTGGVFASWGSLGHITVAEPGATIGFLGARVHDALNDTPFPPGVQVAENLLGHGLLDAVLPLDELALTATRFLDLALLRDTSSGSAARHTSTEARPMRAGSAWEAVTATRNPERPGVRALLKFGASEVLPLSGTGAGERDSSLLLALARFGRRSCVVLGHDRRAEQASVLLGPGGLRVARRGMRLASELGLPLVSVIDTSGAALSKEAEEGGLAGEIARCLSDLTDLDVPTICLLLGQGAGGGALALLPADRVVAAQHSWLSPLPPEGASVILYRTIDRAAEVAEGQQVRTVDLFERGIVDVIVAERPDAAVEPAEFCARVADALGLELESVTTVADSTRLQRRRHRFRTFLNVIVTGDRL